MKRHKLNERFFFLSFSLFWQVHSFRVFLLKMRDFLNSNHIQKLFYLFCLQRSYPASQGIFKKRWRMLTIVNHSKNDYKRALVEIVLNAKEIQIYRAHFWFERMSYEIWKFLKLKQMKNVTFTHLNWLSSLRCLLVFVFVDVLFGVAFALIHLMNVVLVIQNTRLMCSVSL